MPDVEKKTVSASEIAALFGQSPYVTRFLLWMRFARGMDISSDENELMEWGRYMQPYIFKKARDEFGFERIHENTDDLYIRHPTLPIGCTPDGYAWDPQRGLGVIEAKFISWDVFKDQWTQARGPMHYELQLQTQMMVPHPEFGLPKWGMLAVAEHGKSIQLYYYDRAHIEQVQSEIAARSVAFMQSLSGEPPTVVETPDEMAGLTQLWPTIDAKRAPIDVRERHDAIEIAQMISTYQWHKEQEGFNRRVHEGMKPKIVELLQDAPMLRAHGWIVKQSRVPVAPSTVSLPADIKKRLRAAAEAVEPGEAREAMVKATEWETVTRSGSTQVRLNFSKVDGEAPPDPFKDIDLHFGS